GTDERVEVHGADRIDELDRQIRRDPQLRFPFGRWDPSDLLGGGVEVVPDPCHRLTKPPGTGSDRSQMSVAPVPGVERADVEPADEGHIIVDDEDLRMVEPRM